MSAWAGLAGGLLASELIDRPKEEAAQLMQAIERRYSPWTGVKGNIAAVPRADTSGEMMTWGLAGLKDSENKKRYDDETAFRNSVLASLQKQGDNPAKNSAMAELLGVGKNDLSYGSMA